MSVRIVVRGDDRLDLADEIREEFHREVKGVMDEAARIALADVQGQLSLRKGTPRTSAPEGQPPEFDEGDLYRSYRTIPARVKGDAAISGVQSNHPGAARIEFGGVDERGIRTLPHPAVRIGFQNAEPKIEALLEDKLLRGEPTATHSAPFPLIG